MRLLDFMLTRLFPEGKGTRRRRASRGCILALSLSAQTAWAGWTGAICAWGAEDCNRCVPNVVAAVNDLRDHGDVLGFFPLGDPVTLTNHWQGIQRLSAGGGRYLAVSQSGSSRAFHLVEMGSRNQTGARFRSNRIDAGVAYPATPPSSEDRVIREVWLQGLDHDHAGGMQAVGNLLAVPLEGGSGKGRVLIYDLNTPWAPPSQPLAPFRFAETSAAGTASMAKLNDGRFLLVIGQEDANKLEFYVSTGSPRVATTGFLPADTWQEGELRTDIGKREFGNYQNLNLITQCDGSLFLAGTHQNSANGEDWIDLFRVSQQEDGQVVIVEVASKHLYCGYPSKDYSTGAQRHCNLDAAGGLYVDPWGQLIVYGTEHDNDGPGGSVKMMEFRSIFPNPGCESDIQKAFVELYDDSDFSDRGLMIDYPDEWEEDYADLKGVEDFNDKTSAVRYCMPPGWVYRLYEHTNRKGSHVDLSGSGSLNLNTVGFGDETSSGKFIYVGY